MAEHPVTLEGLSYIEGGQLRLAFDRAVQSAALDCYDRPALKASRKVILEVDLKPTLSQDGSYDFAVSSFKVRQKFPERTTEIISLRVRGRNGFTFDDLSEDDARQTTIDDQLQAKLADVEDVAGDD